MLAGEFEVDTGGDALARKYINLRLVSGQDHTKLCSRVTHAPAKIEVAMSKCSGGDPLTRNVTNGRAVLSICTCIRTERRTMERPRNQNNIP